MAKFNVSANGTTFGTYEGDTEQAARDACAVDAGYKSEADMVEQLESPSELQAVIVETETWIAWIDGDKENAVEFEVPLGDTYDVASAGADALGVELSEELNVARK